MYVGIFFMNMCSAWFLCTLRACRLEELIVYAGILELSEKDQVGLPLTVLGIYPHSSYDRDTYEHDIALI